MISHDKVIKQTINKQQKGSSGIIGYYNYWLSATMLSCHAIAEISEEFQNAINGEKKSSTAIFLKPSRMYFDEENVDAKILLLLGTTRLRREKT